jgi:hypothetical protein
MCEWSYASLRECIVSGAIAPSRVEPRVPTLSSLKSDRISELHLPLADLTDGLSV